MSKPKSDDDYVTKGFCDERFLRVMDKLDMIDDKVDNLRDREEQRGRDWKRLVLSVVAGVVVALITWGLAHLP